MQTLFKTGAEIALVEAPYAVFGWAEWVQLMDFFCLTASVLVFMSSPELCFISVLIPDLPVYVNVIFADALIFPDHCLSFYFDELDVLHLYRVTNTLYSNNSETRNN